MRLMNMPTVSAIAGLVATLACGPASADNASKHTAELQPLNESVTGSETKGKASFVRDGDKLTIIVDVQGAPAGIMHLQHFHGFADGEKAAACPSAEDDSNGDGIVDLKETEPKAGTTMVPFHDKPASMEIPSESYPKADADGSYHYEQTVDLAKLQEAFAEAFNGQDLDLERRVVFIHGVDPKTEFPDSVASLGDIPAHITLPIACGKIEAAD
ncbi:hypothetical protein [Methyloligella solikamskensis]|uniref:Superoxide dismutase copper/zinc binding domain-containing protein n=1 Tax=Methyloligella solikamskensis TaxID=1177756 RepID=A0ABW3J740_9HYPH